MEDSCFGFVLLFLCFASIIFVNGEVAVTGGSVHFVGESRTKSSDIVSCVLMMSPACFVDVAEDFLEAKRIELLAEADSRALSRQNPPGESPTQTASVVTRIIVELTNLVRNGISGLFRSDDDDDDDDDERKFSEKDVNTGRGIFGEARKKKKKGKIAGIIKLLVLGAVLKAKLGILLKLLSAKLQIKFFLVALAGLILNAARFYLDLKKGHQPQKVIYYEHAQHQHHYDHEGVEEDWSSGPGAGGSGGYWGRSYDEEEQKKSAQDLAYSQQKPKGGLYSKINNKPSYSWFS